jgi:hypothetical protein
MYVTPIEFPLPLAEQTLCLYLYTASGMICVFTDHDTLTDRVQLFIL